MLLVAKPKCDQPMLRRRSVSATIATPRITDTVMKPPMFHVSGFLERELQALLFNSQDAKEGLAAYVEKRPAEFKAK